MTFDLPVRVAAAALLPFANRHRGGWLTPKRGPYHFLQLHRVGETALTCFALHPEPSLVMLGTLVNSAVRIGWGCPIGRYMKGPHDCEPEWYEKPFRSYFWPRPLQALVLHGFLHGARCAVGGTAVGLVTGANWGWIWLVPFIYAIASPGGVYLHKRFGDIPLPRSWNGAWNEAYMGVICGVLASIIGGIFL